jgi:hypothetical protein
MKKKEQYNHDWQLDKNDNDLWTCKNCGETQRTLDSETLCLKDGEKIYVIKSGKIVLNGKYKTYQEAVHQMGIIKGNKNGKMNVAVWLKKR